MFKWIFALLMGIISHMVAVTATQSDRGLLGWRSETVMHRGVTTSEATFRLPVFVAPFNCELGEVSLINSTLVVGADTNAVHLNLIDGGPEGAGTAEIANIDLVLATDLVVGKTLLFDNIQGASAQRFLTQGDILELEAEEIGTGDGDTMDAFLVRVTFKPAGSAS